MANLEIKKYKGMEEDLSKVDEEGILYLTDEDGKARYVVLPADFFDMDPERGMRIRPQIRILNGDGFELSYDEYEDIKKQILDVFDKTFKPKPENLN